MSEPVPTILQAQAVLLTDLILYRATLDFQVAHLPGISAALHSITSTSIGSGSNAMTLGNALPTRKRKLGTVADVEEPVPASSSSEVAVTVTSNAMKIKRDSAPSTGTHADSLT